MAVERIVSPGVFTQERDLSFLQEGVGAIAGAFIGPTAKGPAFIPTVVTSPQDFENKFGTPDNKSFLGLTVRNYLNESSQATVVRVLGLDGYSNTSHTPAMLYASGTSGSFLYALLHPTVDGVDITAVSASDAPSSFKLNITTTGGSYAGTALSTTNGSAAYFVGELGTGVEGSKGAYVYALFPEAINNAGANVSIGAVLNTQLLNFSGSSYNNASTPWIQSQTLGGSKQNLFKLHTISDGVSANKQFRASIIGPVKGQVSGSDYATFGLILRDLTTGAPIDGGQWLTLDLNPNSPNYIARRIGNSAPTTNPNTNEIYYEGEYANTNPYIYVEMADGVENLSTDAVPFGFAALQTPFAFGVVNGLTTASISPTFISSSWTLSGVRGYQAGATYNANEYYGFQYPTTLTQFNTNVSLLAPLASGSTSVGAAFSLENLGNTEIQNSAGSFVTVANFLNNASGVTNKLKFDIPFQGGFDGLNPAREILMYSNITATNTQGFDLSTSTAAGTTAYVKALNAIANPDAYDMNLLVLPGVVHSLHPYVSDYALSVCENRGDAFYIMDLTDANSSVVSAVQEAALLDTNYAAGYYPWVKVVDTNNTVRFVPPSVVLPEVYGYSDRIQAEWYAPAGLNRGGIRGAVGVKTRLTQSDRDTLYEGKVNPIASFTGQGVCVWGQKTLQRRASALDRVNVRRLLITVKKFIASSARFLVFEQNVEATRNRFLSIANPFLASIQERSGLYSFRVVMDDSNNTPDVIDRNTLVGAIYLQPTKTAEFITLEFNILPTGATFVG